MIRTVRPWMIASAATIFLFLVTSALADGLWWSTLSEQEHEQLLALLYDRWVVMLLPILPMAGFVVWVWQWLEVRYAKAAVRLQERVALLVHAPLGERIDTNELKESADAIRLMESINDLAANRDQWRSDMRDQIARESEGVQQERNRLAALISELSQSVVVCNLNGMILLFNNRARLQFKALSAVSSVAGGAEWIGIGRSIYAVLDRDLLAHGLDNLQIRIDRGATKPVTQFLTSTSSGQLLRIHMAPVFEAEQGGAMSGFVLMLDNVTQFIEQDNAKTQMLLSLVEDAKQSLTRIQAGLARKEGASDDVMGQVLTMRSNLDCIVNHVSEDLKTRWPLEEMPVSDLIKACQRRISQVTQCEVLVSDVSATEWVKVDSFSLVQVVTYLTSRLADEFGVKQIEIAASNQQQKVCIDLIWTGQVMSTETVMSWELDPMHLADGHNPLSVRDVLIRHGGALSFERERVRHKAYFRLALPSTQVEEADTAHGLLVDSRPDYFDFDLFAQTEHAHDIDDRLLTSLTYTVFDTETTGLSPSQGDQIIQIGATRIVNGRLLKSDAFEQLIDPKRHIPESTIPIHGITPEMVRGKPSIGEVLPAFHAYAADTILVAHNAAFDMRFLQMQEQATGVRFDQPVLDTLMLSAVIHPNQESHRLEAIAQRMNITILGRHTALGDALVTAEVFLRMIPLLAAQGIHTYGQAREAAQRTYYARLKY
mgnify:CR=1 FL=1